MYYGKQLKLSIEYTMENYLNCALNTLWKTIQTEHKILYGNLFKFSVITNTVENYLRYTMGSLQNAALNKLTAALITWQEYVNCILGTCSN